MSSGSNLLIRLVLPREVYREVPGSPDTLSCNLTIGLRRTQGGCSAGKSIREVSETIRKLFRYKDVYITPKKNYIKDDGFE